MSMSGSQSTKSDFDAELSEALHRVVEAAQQWTGLSSKDDSPLTIFELMTAVALCLERAHLPINVIEAGPRWV